jgi:hypothetical protein
VYWWIFYGEQQHQVIKLKEEILIMIGGYGKN